MAELANKGTYVRLLVNVWWDRSNKRVHITSNDSDLPTGGMHLSAKLGSQSDVHLRQLLNDFGCGPDSPMHAGNPTQVLKVAPGPATALALAGTIENGDWDSQLDVIKAAVLKRSNEKSKN